MAAWSDPDWGALVWLAVVTGVRRGELCGLRWRNVDLDAAVLALNRSIGQRNRETWEKDTKTHQHRRIALDPETVGILAEHRRRCADRAAALNVELSGDAFVFSLAPDGSSYLRPNSVSERYSDMADRLGIRTSLHKLRHCTATEPIAAGVDVRTVAGRLGHGGGGTTTLRVYAAWVSESDQRAATSLFSRMPARPSEAAPSVTKPDRPPYPYEEVAADLRDAIEAARFPVGAFLPRVKALAAERAVAVGTAHRALSLLADWGYADVVPGRGFRVVAQRAPAVPPIGGERARPHVAVPESSPLHQPPAPCAEDVAPVGLWSVTLRGPVGLHTAPRLVRASLDDPDSFRPHLVGIARIEVPSLQGPPRRGSASTNSKYGSRAPMGRRWLSSVGTDRAASRRRTRTLTSGVDEFRRTGSWQHVAPRGTFRQIADELRQLIRLGELSPGAAVPSELTLVEQHGVSRGTVRSALSVLTDEGLIEVVPGQGRRVVGAPAGANPSMAYARIAAALQARLDRRSGR